MDDHHLRITTLSCSCGGIQVYQLTEDAHKMLYALANYLYHPARGDPVAFVVWSDGDWEGSRGHKLYLKIREILGDGGIMIEKGMENPKTSNLIAFYFWKIPHESFRLWWTQEKIRRLLPRK